MLGDSGNMKKWLQFEDGGFEPRDPYEDLRTRQEQPGNMFWEVAKPSDWLPDADKYRKPKNKDVEPEGIFGGLARKRAGKTPASGQGVCGKHFRAMSRGAEGQEDEAVEIRF